MNILSPREGKKKDRVKFLTVLGSTASNFNEGRSIVRLVYRVSFCMLISFFC